MTFLRPPDFIALPLLLLLPSCAPTAYDFLHAKTSIEISREVRICTNGTAGNDATCRPTETGGGKWVRAENFDIFSLAVPDATGEVTLDEVKARYLATPYWGGHVQLGCKREVSIAEFGPEISVSSDEIDLAQALRQESARSFEVDVFAKLPGPVPAAARAAFQDRVAELIRTRIQVRLRWFVARFTGGRYAMNQHPGLNACRNEADLHARDDAHLITGVAGFAVLMNHADTSITDRQNVEWALGALVNDAAPKLFDDGAGASWAKTVHRVLRVDATTTQMTPTVYPLWVQLE